MLCSLSSGIDTLTPSAMTESCAPIQVTEDANTPFPQANGKPKTASTSIAIVRSLSLVGSSPITASKGSSTYTSTRASVSKKIDANILPMAAAKRPQILGDDLPPTRSTLKAMYLPANFVAHVFSLRCSDGDVVKGIGDIQDEPFELPALS